MKITSLHIKDFRNHVDMKIQFDRFTFIVGPNAVGKTSVAMAIEVLLTGWCAVTDPAGRGGDDLIRIGAREFYIAGQLGKALIERSRGPKGQVLDIGGRSGPITDMQSKIYQGLGVTPDVLSAVLNASRFLGMKDTDQKKLLTQLLASEAPKIPDDILTTMGEVDTDFEPTIHTVTDVDAAHKHFYALRTDVSRDLKTLGEQDEPELPQDAPEPARAREQLDSLRKTLTGLTSNRAHSDGQYESKVKAAADKRASLKQQRMQAEARQLKDHEAESYQAVLENGPKIEKLTAHIATLDKSIQVQEREWEKEVAGRRAVLNQEARGLDEQIGARERLIETLAQIKSAECPTCQRILTANEKVSMGAKLQDDIDALNKKLKEKQAEQNQEAFTPAALSLLRTDRDKSQEKLDDLGDIAAADIAMKEHRQSVVDVTRCDRELKAIEDPKKPDHTEIDADIAKLQERITKGEGVLEQLRDIDGARAAFSQWQTKKQDLAVMVENLTKLIEFFGPNGIKTKMVGDKMAPFIEALNQTLGQFGYACAFELEPYGFWVSPVEADFPRRRSLKQLSESEGFRFGVAFQIALAMATNLKLVVIDRADVLVGEQRRALTSMLMNSELEQAIVLSSTDKPIPAELPQGVKFIQL